MDTRQDNEDEENRNSKSWSWGTLLDVCWHVAKIVYVGMKIYNDHNENKQSNRNAQGMSIPQGPQGPQGPQAQQAQQGPQGPLAQPLSSDQVRVPVDGHDEPVDDDIEDDSETCKICYENKIKTVNYPCGHSCLCFTCAIKLVETDPKCPICNQPLQEIKKFFKV